jgi:hypothetical protein
MSSSVDLARDDVDDHSFKHYIKGEIDIFKKEMDYQEDENTSKVMLI